MSRCGYGDMRVLCLAPCECASRLANVHSVLEPIRRAPWPPTSSAQPPHPTLLPPDAFHGFQVFHPLIPPSVPQSTLHRAITSGIFTRHPRWPLRVSRRAMARTATEIARGMMHLHSCGRAAGGGLQG